MRFRRVSTYRWQAPHCCSAWRHTQQAHLVGGGVGDEQVAIWRPPGRARSAKPRHDQLHREAFGDLGLAWLAIGAISEKFGVDFPTGGTSCKVSWRRRPGLSCRQSPSADLPFSTWPPGLFPPASWAEIALTGNAARASPNANAFSIAPLRKGRMKSRLARPSGWETLPHVR